MATKKDLVEAQSFSKRRLVTAFVSGAPGGREVEPHRPMRAVLGGLGLSVVLVLGALAFGWLKGSLPQGWQNDKLVIAKSSGARYVSVNGTLHPVLNSTSARLMIPARNFAVITVDDDKIATVKRGATLGIFGAPDSLTPPDALSNSGWVSCLADNQTVRTAIGPSARSTVSTPAAAIVTTNKTAYLIAGGLRYPIASNSLAAVQVALGLENETPRPAPAVWTNLFASGPELRPITIAAFGRASPGLPPGASVGSVLAVGNSGEKPRRYLVNAAGDLEPLPDFAHALYRIGSGSTTEDLPVTPADVAGLTVVAQRIAPASWPTAVTPALSGLPCATLTTAPATPPVVTLSTSPTVSGKPGGTAVNVDVGTGALVRAVGAGALNSGPMMTIDQTGTAFAIDSQPEDVLARLGYSTADVAAIPQSWADLFRAGPRLGVRAAQTTVTTPTR